MWHGYKRYDDGRLLRMPSLIRLREKRLDAARETLQIGKPFLENLFYQSKIDLQLATDENVAEPGERP